MNKPGAGDDETVRNFFHDDGAVMMSDNERWRSRSPGTRRASSDGLLCSINRSIEVDARPEEEGHHHWLRRPTRGGGVFGPGQTAAASVEYGL